MNFTYSGYELLLKCIRNSGYTLTPFRDAETIINPKAIIRHDVDLSPEKALRIAALEHYLGVKATYFFLLGSEWYNLLSADSLRCMKEILSMGHEIGLHFDASQYAGKPLQEIEWQLIHDIRLLDEITGAKVKSVSWHIPVDELLGKKLPMLESLGIKNAYDPEYFSGYKYLSDSMMRWRDNPFEYMDTTQYPNIQVLTHPVWYGDTESETSLDILKKVFNQKSAESIRYLERILPGFKDQLRGAV